MSICNCRRVRLFSIEKIIDKLLGTSTIVLSKYIFLFIFSFENDHFAAETVISTRKVYKIKLVTDHGYAYYIKRL